MTQHTPPTLPTGRFWFWLIVCWPVAVWLLFQHQRDLAAYVATAQHYRPDSAE